MDGDQEAATASDIVNSDVLNSDGVIVEAIKRIVDATTNPMDAINAVELLKSELKLAYGDDDDDDDASDKESEGQVNDLDDSLRYPTSDDPDEDDDANAKDGDWVLEPHKKNETDKWRELLVHPAMRSRC
jgi:hypothetical protein